MTEQTTAFANARIFDGVSAELRVGQGPPASAGQAERLLEADGI